MLYYKMIPQSSFCMRNFLEMSRRSHVNTEALCFKCLGVSMNLSRRL